MLLTELATDERSEELEAGTELSRMAEDARLEGATLEVPPFTIP